MENSTSSYDIVRNKLEKLLEMTQDSLKKDLKILDDIKTLGKRIENIDKRVEDLEQFIIYNAHKFLKPHKCLICDGEGRDKSKVVIDEAKEPFTVHLKNPPCHSCSGKGVVWK